MRRGSIAGILAIAVATSIGIWHFIPQTGRTVRTPLLAAPRASETAALPDSPAELPPPATIVKIDDAPQGPSITGIIISPYFDNAEAVNQLIALLPRLSPDEQAEAASHIANLSSDADVAKWGGALVEGALPRSAADVLFLNLSNRPAEVGWPILAAIADTPVSVYAAESASTLEILVGRPARGTTWSAQVSQQLAPHTTSHHLSMQ